MGKSQRSAACQMTPNLQGYMDAQEESQMCIAPEDYFGCDVTAIWGNMAFQQDYLGADGEPDLTPVFEGFEDDRYQEHDALIEQLVSEYNSDPAAFIGATEDQVADMPPLDPALVKAWLIQESGGNDERSRAAWAVDPGQVNVPGDWSDDKSSLGLTEPTARNEGDLETNIRAAIGWLARKGFGRSGQPPENRPTGTFDGWATALERYNGRGVTTDNGLPYRENYSQRIRDRASDPSQHQPISLPQPQ